MHGLWLFAVRWRSWTLLLLVATLVGSRAQTPFFNLAHPLFSNLTSVEASTLQAFLDEGEAPTTCRLTLEGGLNTSELLVYGTSIAHAELTCTGAIMRITIHPVLAPFVQRFKGVEVAGVVDM